MHTALVSGWAGSMALYELAVFDPSDPILKSNVETRYVCSTFYDSFRNNTILGWLEYYWRNVQIAGIWSYEGVAAVTYCIYQVYYF